MQIVKRQTFVNEWKFDKMSIMFHLRIDIRTKEMLNIKPYVIPYKRPSTILFKIFMTVQSALPSIETLLCPKHHS